MKKNEIKPSELLLEQPKRIEQTIEISVSEYVHLKDIQTRFEILKNEMIHSSYCPIHHQIILGIEEEYAAKKLPDLSDLVIPSLKKTEKELNADMFPGKWDQLKK